MKPLSVALTVLAGVLIGCEDPAREIERFTDVSGVRFTLSAEEHREFGSVEPVPSVSIGGPEVDGPSRFFRISGVHLDRLGRIWVADGQSGEVRIFNSDGSHWKTFGGQGEGPGEFRRIRLLGAFSGDSVAVSDDAQGRITIVTPEGTLARSWRVAVGEPPVQRTHRVFPNGDVLGQVPRVFRAGSLEPGQLIADTARLVRVPVGAAEPVAVATVPGPIWLWTGRNQVPVPFTANPALAVQDDALHVSAGPDFRIAVFGSDGPSEIYGLAREPSPVQPTDVDSYRRTSEDFVPPDRLEDYLSALDHPARPTHTPGYLRLLVSADQLVWAQRFTPTVWDVYGPDRAWLGQIEMPEGFSPEVVTSDELIGTWRDEQQVEHVRVYRFATR